MKREDIIVCLKDYKAANKDKYQIINIGLFGSVARNAMDSQSDIDVVVKLKKQDLFNIIGIKQDLEERLHRSVDIVSYREKMNKFLKSRIDDEAVYV